MKVTSSATEARRPLSIGSSAVKTTRVGTPSAPMSRVIDHSPSTTGVTVVTASGMSTARAVVGESSQPWENENCRVVRVPAGATSGDTPTCAEAARGAVSTRATPMTEPVAMRGRRAEV